MLIVSLGALLCLWQPGGAAFQVATAQVAPPKPVIRIKDVVITQFSGREATLVVGVENERMGGQEVTVGITITDDWCGTEILRRCEDQPDVAYFPAVTQSEPPGNTQTKQLNEGVTEFEWRVSTTKASRRLKFVAGVVGCGTTYPNCQGVDLKDEDRQARESGVLLFR
jgi:hypothetical protein